MNCHENDEDTSGIATSTSHMMMNMVHKSGSKYLFPPYYNTSVHTDICGLSSNTFPIKRLQL